MTPRRIAVGPIGSRGHAPQVGTVFAIALVVLVLVMDRRLDLYDEGLVLTAAMRMRAGDMPHRDFYFVYGPAGPWLLSKLWTMSPAWFLIERVYGIVIQSALVAVCYRLLRSRVSLPVALLFSVACLLWVIGWRNYLYPSFPSVLSALIGASLLLRRDDIRPRPASIVLAGGCAGVATLFRYDAGLPIMAAQGAYLVLLGRCDVAARRGIVWIGRDLAIMLLGFGLVIAPVMWIYWQGDVFASWRQDVITSATTYYVSHRGLPFPAISGLWRRPVLAAAYLPIAAAMLGVVTFMLPRHRGGARADPQGRKFALATGSLALALYYKGVVRPEPVHFLMSVVPATILVALCADRLLRGGRRQRVVAVATIALSLMPPAYGAGSALRRMMSEPDRTIVTGWATPAGPAWPSGMTASCGPAAAMLGASLPDAPSAAVAFIRDRSRPGDRVLVMTGRTDRFIINSPALYFAMDRQPGTHWHVFDPGLQTRVDIQRDMIRDLARNDVRWIVRDAIADDVREPNASSVSSGVRLLDEWVGRRYRRVMTRAAMSVWLRNGDVLPMRRCPPARGDVTATGV